MKRIAFRLTALVLALALLLTGCALDFGGYFSRLAQLFQPITFESMTYTRPDPALLDDALAACLKSAEGDKLSDLVGKINTLNSICNSFQTNYYLAYIHYCIDMTDAYWAEQYTHCSQINTRVQVAVDELMYALAASDLRSELEFEEYFGPGYFDDYDGDSLWTEEYKALIAEETNLINQYYELSSMSNMMDVQSEGFYSTLGAQMELIYLELIKVRQRIASEAGYSSYGEYAYECTYNRSYTPAQTRTLLSSIRTELVDPYIDLADSNVWQAGATGSTEDQTFQYVKSLAQSTGGTIQEAFTLMESGGLYHISYGANKFGASFAVYLPEYSVPFVFMNPTTTVYDRLTFSHEFGHFCNAYAAAGSAASMASIDVGEFFSQGLEYLSLYYADGGDDLTAVKLADSLCVYIEQSFLADFEDRLYNMDSSALTVENIRKLYTQTASDYGFGEYVDNRGYVNISHLFTSPMYVISYVISNDAAMQLYRMEQSTPGSGLECYTAQLSTTQSDFLVFLEEAGLENPFDLGHIAAIKTVFEDILK